MVKKNADEAIDLKGNQIVAMPVGHEAFDAVITEKSEDVDS
jgi:hypothetical protein